MASASVPPPANDRKRVKVYKLVENNHWFERGTGFCMGIASVGISSASYGVRHRDGAMLSRPTSADLCDHSPTKRKSPTTAPRPWNTWYLDTFFAIANGFPFRQLRSGPTTISNSRLYHLLRVRRACDPFPHARLVCRHKPPSPHASTPCTIRV